ncbi:hypothetical protein GP486_007303 [Trichoglossum hirsutum]|uniref:C2H2-type domain-containing protein n=1 Tax=Trichoglossum hirsutum TaxID=265104 RepID=A0A9P8IJK0_9PEZI|nr:hypothetical protein GP486_007303 [Trichoglossum hirsutum]
MDPFYYYRQYRVLVCKSCQYAIQPTHIAAHLRSDQHKLSRKLSEEIANQYQNNDFADPRTELIAPKDIITPIEYLTIYRDGLKCSYCNYICRAIEVMKRHQRQTHNIRAGRGRRIAQVEWTIVWCQQFFTGVGRHFFQVQQTNQSDNPPTDATAQLLHLVHRQLDQKEKVIQEKKQLIRDAEDVTEVSPWLERTQWIRHLEGQDKASMVQLIKPAQVDEMELKEVEKSLKRLVEKARQTILQRRISTFMLHRLESFHSGQDAAKPFHINMNPQTVERYQHIWSQLLVYVLWTADSDSQLYRLKQDQRSCMQELLVAANRVLQYEEEELEEEEVEVMQKELDRSCLALRMALLDHRLNHDEYESAIVSCLAIMGLEYIPGSSTTTQYKFKDSAQVTPILSGFIKIAQILTVQYCLEEEESNEVESCRELLEELHTRFLTVGTATPMDWMLRLRLYGRGIIKRLTAEGCINWIGDTVIYQDIELSMLNFRRLVHQLVEETQSVLIKDLLFVEEAEGQLPTYSWTELKDNPAKDEPGWYFVYDQRNQMHEQGRWLLDQILQTSKLADQFIHHSTGVWKQKRVNDYLDNISYFMEKLLILIYMTSGQPARSREWLSIRYCNTEKGGHRCIFVENGLLVVVTYYHKGYNITGTEKIIHRYLPQEVSELLLLYIWLVLPLRQQLQQLVFNDDEIPTAFLWSIDRHKKWTGDRVQEVLKRESDRLIGVPLNKKTYRHIAIAISDRYMKRTKFDKDKEEKKKDLDENE